MERLQYITYSTDLDNSSHQMGCYQIWIKALIVLTVQKYKLLGTAVFHHSVPNLQLSHCFPAIEAHPTFPGAMRTLAKQSGGGSDISSRGDRRRRLLGMDQSCMMTWTASNAERKDILCLYTHMDSTLRLVNGPPLFAFQNPWDRAVGLHQ
jgi:hypothetical protein